METKAQPSVQQGFTTGQPTPGPVIFVGHARLPQSLAGPYASPVVSVELEADMGAGIIQSVAAKGIPTMGARLLGEVLPGRSLRDGPEGVAEEIRRRYVCPSHKALCTAVINAYEAYHRYQQQESLPS